MSIHTILSFVVTFIIAAFLVPLVGKVTKNMGIIAHENKRTIHHGIIPRTGGYAIYIAFLIGAMIFLKTDVQINSVLIGGFIIFMVGFYDDIHDLPPKVKIAGQVLAALVVILYGGISLKDFMIPNVPTNISTVLAIIITIGWIIGITNAVNLIDGLDGLCAGISIIVLVTITVTSITSGRSDIASLSMLLAGSIAGFLLYNFHPAKIFMGDCGALFIGFMISVISLLGFGYKGSTFFTLGAPIVVLAVPIMDTLIAIIRRKVHHKRFDEADRGHLHHKLMFSLELGQTKSVLILYAATALFSLCSYLNLNHPDYARILFITLLIIFEIFVEYTNMISRKYKPILTIINIFLHRDDLPKIKESEPYRKIVRNFKGKLKYVLLVIVVVIASYYGYQYTHRDTGPKIKPITYVEVTDGTELMKTIYKDIESTRDRTALREYVAAYFAADFYSLKNKDKDEIGGTNYFYQDKLSDFQDYAKKDYYASVNKLIANGENTDNIVSYEVLSNTVSETKLAGLEDYNYYDVILHLQFNHKSQILNTKDISVTIRLIDKNHKYYVVSYSYNGPYVKPNDD